MEDIEQEAAEKAAADDAAEQSEEQRRRRRAAHPRRNLGALPAVCGQPNRFPRPLSSERPFGNVDTMTSLANR
jgi:hypothetical protein